MTKPRRSSAPRTPAGWSGAALGAGLIVDLRLLSVLSNTVTDGGSQAARSWPAAVMAGGVLAVAAPAVVIRMRSRWNDPSVLVTVAFVLAWFIGGWVLFATVAEFFFQ